MVVRSQISLDGELHRKAKRRAAELGISLAEYFRRLVAGDVGKPRATVNPTSIFDLGSSGASDVARHKDDYLGEAVEAAHVSSRRRTRRQR